MNQHLSKLQKRIQEHTGIFVNFCIVFVTSGLEQLVTLAIYKCSCVINTFPNKNCQNVSTYLFVCTDNLNRIYGLAFILIPAPVLFVFSISGNAKVWKIITGRCHKLQTYKQPTLN